MSVDIDSRANLFISCFMLVVTYEKTTSLGKLSPGLRAVMLDDRFDVNEVSELS